MYTFICRRRRRSERTTLTWDRTIRTTVCQVPDADGTREQQHGTRHSAPSEAVTTTSAAPPTSFIVSFSIPRAYRTSPERHIPTRLQQNTHAALGDFMRQSSHQPSQKASHSVGSTSKDCRIVVHVHSRAAAAFAATLGHRRPSAAALQEKGSNAGDQTMSAEEYTIRGARARRRRASMSMGRTLENGASREAVRPSRASRHRRTRQTCGA